MIIPLLVLFPGLPNIRFLSEQKRRRKPLVYFIMWMTSDREVELDRGGERSRLKEHISHMHSSFWTRRPGNKARSSCLKGKLMYFFSSLVLEEYLSGRSRLRGRVVHQRRHGRVYSSSEDTDEIHSRRSVITAGWSIMCSYSGEVTQLLP